jgi:hypothetical protein
MECKIGKRKSRDIVEIEVDQPSYKRIKVDSN